jgi:predicted aspartyl protease
MYMHFRIALLAVVTTLGLPPAGAAGAVSGSAVTNPVEQLLEEARDALGLSGWEAGHDLRLAGRASLQGVDETFEADYARDGRFRLAFRGELTRRSRFDGLRVRLAEYSTLWYDLELHDREVELMRGLVHGGAWLDAQAGVIVTAAAGWEPAEGRTGLDLRLADGLLPFRLELDAEDHLVRSLSLVTENGALRSEYEEHRAVGGLMIAHRVRAELSVGGVYLLEVTSAAQQDTDPARFTVVADRLDYTFDADVPADVPVVRSRSKHLFVRPLINGKDVGLFLFDTGAGFSGISLQTAEALGLESFGVAALTGLGGGVTETGMRRAARVQLGPLIIDDLVFSETRDNHKFEEEFEEKIAGVLGWDVMRRAIVDLEPRGALRLFDPADFELSPPMQGAWQDIRIHFQVPWIRGRFPGDHEGLFMLDCGAAGSTVMFFHHAASSLGLLEDDEHAGPVDTSHGAGGSYQRRLGRMDWFEFGDDHLDDMRIILSIAPDGEADPHSLGLIGGGLLRLYRLVFDVQRKRVMLSQL